MQKTRMGISVGLLSAAIYFTALFSGYLAPVLLAGYVLLFEENDWLKRNAVKAVVLMTCFSFVMAVIGLLPDLISFINDVFVVFDESFHVAIISKVLQVVTSAISILEKVLFLALGLKALNQGSFSVPVVDDMLNKYM